MSMTLLIFTVQPDPNMTGHLIVQGVDRVAHPIDLRRAESRRLQACHTFTGVKPEFHEAHPVLVRQGIVIADDFAVISGLQGP